MNPALSAHFTGTVLRQTSVRRRIQGAVLQPERLVLGPRVIRQPSSPHRTDTLPGLPSSWRGN